MFTALIAAAALTASPTAYKPAIERQAEALSATEAVALLRCTAQADGRVTDYKVTGETPSDLGVGAAALAMAAQFRIDPTADDGRSLAGSPVDIPVRIQIKR